MHHTCYFGIYPFGFVFSRTLIFVLNSYATIRNSIAFFSNENFETVENSRMFKFKFAKFLRLDIQSCRIFIKIYKILSNISSLNLVTLGQEEGKIISKFIYTPNVSNNHTSTFVVFFILYLWSFVIEQCAINLIQCFKLGIFHILEVNYSSTYPWITDLA